MVNTNPSAVVGVFEDRIAAEKAVDQLHQAGFPTEDVGFVIRGSDVEQTGMITDAEGTKDMRGAAAGMVAGGVVGGVLAAFIALVIPGVGPILAGGVLASFFGGALAGTAVGGILGALQGLGVSENEAAFYEQQFHSGRAIVAVRAGSRGAEAADVLVRFGGQHIHNEPTSPIPTEGVFHTL